MKKDIVILGLSALVGWMFLKLNDAREEADFAWKILGYPPHSCMVCSGVGPLPDQEKALFRGRQIGRSVGAK